jgi:hypothetical protein
VHKINSIADSILFGQSAEAFSATSYVIAEHQVAAFGGEIPGNHEVPRISHDKKRFVRPEFGDALVIDVIDVQGADDSPSRKRFRKNTVPNSSGISATEQDTLIGVMGKSGVLKGQNIGDQRLYPLTAGLLDTAVENIRVTGLVQHGYVLGLEPGKNLTPVEIFDNAWRNEMTQVIVPASKSCQVPIKGSQHFAQAGRQVLHGVNPPGRPAG